MRIRNALAASLLAATLIFLMAASVQAHSLLVSSNPPSGAKLATAPANVQMTFSEGVEPAFSTFAVIDRTRKHFEVGAPTIDRVMGLVTVVLQPNLAPGNYAVQWKVVSVVDGHLTRGSFAFNVQAPAGSTAVPTYTLSNGSTAVPGSSNGTGTATPEPTIEPLPDLSATADGGTTGEATAPGIIDVAVRWLDTLLAACVIGGAVFSLLIVPGVIARLPQVPKRPQGSNGQGLRDAQETQEAPEPEEGAEIRTRLEARFMRGALVATGLLILTLGAELVLQAMRATETDIGAVFSQPGVFSAVLGSSFGSSLELRALAALAILVLLVIGLVTHKIGRGLSVLWALVALVGAVYFWAQTQSAHATALSEQPNAGILQGLAPVSNLLHLLATAIWIGGIYYFVTILLPVLRGLTPRGRTAVLRDSIASFSRVAVITVPILAVSGTVMYLAEQPSVASTLNTDYGRDVLIKVGLLCLLMIPAAYNLRRVGPGLARLREKFGPAFQSLAKGFRRSIRIEALLVSTVLIFSALLTLSAPATDPSVYAGNADNSANVATPPVVAQVSTQVPTTSPLRPTPPTPVLPPTAQPTETTPPSATLTLTQTVRGVDVSLTLSHGQLDNLNIALRGPSGPIAGCDSTPVAGVDCALTVKLTLTELDDNTSGTIEAPPDGKAGFAVPEGPYLPFDGAWQVVVAVRRYNQPDDIKAAFRYVLDGANMTGKVSNYVNVVASTNPDPPRSGPVDLTFHLTDNNGQPVNDATIMLQGIMPAHGHVTDVTKMSNTAGTYTANLLMPMSGGWSLELTISRPGHDTVASEVSLDVARSTYDLTPYPSPNTTPVAP